MAAQGVMEDSAASDAPKPETGGKSKKKKLIVIAAALVLLLGGAGGAYFMGLFGGSEPAGEEGHAAEEAEAEAEPGHYFDVPEMLVNLNTNGKRAGFLKIRVALELESAEAVHEVDAVLPRIIDSFQVYLRELRIEDLRGSAGLYRLREELLLRVNTAMHPAQVRDVLFKEMLVQ